MRNHGEIWLANLNPGRGSEPGKIRPVLILQNQALLDAGHPSTLIIPLTTNLVDGAEPLRLRVVARGDLNKDSDLLVDQLRAIDNKRLIDGPLLRLDDEALGQVYQAVAEVLGMELAGRGVVV
ncbi:MAG: type II toxin-antitoxin system PemK/MazF family toxin [Geobacteraceae bacterium]|nr:type II toxin-antitoxin system PemK/MazF family toxin [Geobacteraceae bacterium]